MKSIPLKTWEVKAILDGRKTQTRRPVKPPPIQNEAGRWVWPIPKSKIRTGCCPEVCTASREWWEYLSPEQFPYQPGDLVYVKEKWTRFDCCSCEGDTRGKCFNEKSKKFDGCYLYGTTHEIWGDIKWRPSIHMPKEAARIWLEVEEVRVERVQDITENDADWEGVGKCPYEHRVYGAYGYGHDSMCWAEGDCRNPNKACSKSLREHFCEYWNSLYAKRGFGWDTNPWVWVIEFEVTKP